MVVIPAGTEVCQQVHALHWETLIYVRMKNNLHDNFLKNKKSDDVTDFFSSG